MTPILRLPPKARRPVLLPWLLAAAAVASATFAPHGILSIVAGRHAATGRTADPSTSRFVPATRQQSLDYARVGSKQIALARGVTRIVVPRGSSLSIIGWAVDAAARRPSSAVFGAIGNTELPARSGLARDDVATAFGDPVYRPSGFELDVPANALQLGRTRLSLFGIDAGGTGRYQIGRPIDIVVTSR